MSGIVGIWHLDGQPVEPQLLKRMTDALAHRGPDGVDHWIDGSIGLGHRLLHTTPESLHETQPFTSDDGNLVIVCDGRIDNRSELKAALGSTLRTDTDVELILNAYEKWGADCPTHLIGDFTFAIWDQPKRRLFCARDPIGVKTFYYHWDGRRLLFASALNAFWAVPHLPKRPNDLAIAEYLLADLRDSGATFFEGIAQLRPGHSLCVEQGALRLARYWRPEGSAPIRYREEADYLAHFRDLFDEAVRCRLGTAAPAGVLLSGGIDSTLVTATSAALRRAHPTLPAVKAFTVLYEELLQEEWQAIQRLVRQRRVDLQVIQPETVEGPLALFELFVSRTDTPYYHGFLTHPLILQTMAQQGYRTILTGIGADELVGTSDLGVLLDLLRRGRFIRLTQEITRTAWASNGKSSEIALYLLREAVSPRTRWRIKAHLHRQLPAWIEPTLATRLGLASRLPDGQARRFPSMCQEESVRALTSPAFLLGLNQLDEAASTFGLECCHPFLDRRLIEYVLAIPWEIKLNAGKRKLLAQRALTDATGGLLRPQVGREPFLPSHETDPDRLASEAMQIREALGPPSSPIFRYLSYTQTTRMLQALLHGQLWTRSVLWKGVSLSRWLQRSFDHTTSEDLVIDREPSGLADLVASSFTGGGG